MPAPSTLGTSSAAWNPNVLPRSDRPSLPIAAQLPSNAPVASLCLQTDPSFSSAQRRDLAPISTYFWLFLFFFVGVCSDNPQQSADLEIWARRRRRRAAARNLPSDKRHGADHSRACYARRKSSMHLPVSSLQKDKNQRIPTATIQTAEGSRRAAARTL